MIDKKVFLEAMTALSEMFDKKLSKITLQMYYKVLSSQLDTEQFKKAVEIWMLKGKFFPKPSELVEVLNETQGNTAEKAWFEILKEIERKGIYGSPNFNDPITYAVVQAMGGWEAFCNMPVDKQNFYLKEFESLYNAYKNRPEIIENALPSGMEVDRKALATVFQKAKALSTGREN